MSSTSTGATKTLTVRAGETAILKSGVTILSVIKEGNISATSNCGDLQSRIDTAEGLSCFRVMWVAEGNKNNDTGPFSWVNGDMKIQGFGIDNRFFDMGNHTLNPLSGENGRSEAFIAKLKGALGGETLIVPHSMKRTGNIGERDEFQFKFQAPESMGLTAYLRISSPSGGDPSYAVARFYAEECSGCCT